MYYGRTFATPTKDFEAQHRRTQLPPKLAALQRQNRFTGVVGKKEAEDQGIDLNGSIDQFSADSQTRINEALLSGDFSLLTPIEVAWINAQVQKTTGELEAQAAAGDQAADVILAEKAQMTQEAQVAEIGSLEKDKRSAARAKLAKNAGAVLLLGILGYGVFKMTGRK